MSASRLEYRAVEPHDAGTQSALFAEVFSQNRSEAAWQWAYALGPWGPAVVMGAFDGPTLVAQQAGLLRPVMIAGAVYLAAQSVDAMTTTSRWRQGVQRALFPHFLGALRARGAELLFGFTNENSTPGALGYQQRTSPGPLPLLARPLWGGLKGWLPGAITPPRKMDQPPLTVPTDIVALAELERWSEPRAAAFDRSAPWLKWRLTKPGGQYRTVELRRGGQLRGYGAVAFRQQGPLWCAFAAELVAESPAARGQLASALVDVARDHFAQVFLALGTPGTQDRVAWMGRGLAPVPARLNPESLTFSYRWVQASDAAAQILPWSVRWFDHDVL